MQNQVESLLCTSAHTPTFLNKNNSSSNFHATIIKINYMIQ